MVSSVGSSGIIRRALRNAGLMLGGKAATGLMQLATFALTARALGLQDFGRFSVLLAQVQLLAGLAAFQTSQAVIRYGVPHLEQGRREAFQALVKASTMLDLGAAIVATLATLLLAPLMVGWFGWDAAGISEARLIAPLALAGAIATPKAMLRLFDRFDLLTSFILITPGVRLAGAILGWAVGAGMIYWLALWMLAGFAGAVAALWMAWREAARRGLLAGIGISPRELTDENPGLWRFSLVTNLSSSLALIPTQLSTVLVGAILGPAAAGIFKIARELGTAFGRPVDLLNQSVFPDVARLVAADQWARLRRTITHAGLIASGASLLITLLLLVVGGPLISFAFGSGYRPALPVLIAISAATTLQVALVAVEPALHAMGRAGAALVTALCANLAFALLLLWRLPRDGLMGAGVAFVGASLVALALSAFWLRRAVGR